MGNKWTSVIASILVALSASHTRANAEILAIVNYESARQEFLVAIAHPAALEPRREGLIIIDVDPRSERYGVIVSDIPLPPDFVSHHLYYSKDRKKIYITGLGRPELRVLHLDEDPYQMQVVSVPGCDAGEDVAFSARGRWYLTCMGSNIVIVGDANTDKPIGKIVLPYPHPHGIAVKDDVDRILVTSTVRPTDLGDPGNLITSINISAEEVISSYEVSQTPGSAPVEIAFRPSAAPVRAYVTNMYGNSLGRIDWKPDLQEFKVSEVYSFAAIGAQMPMEMYFNDAADRLYVTTTNPGQLHIFEIGQDPDRLQLRVSLSAAPGAHHVAFTNDGRYGFVQNSMLNLPGMSSGAITVIDMKTESVIGNINTFKNLGLNPNSILLLPPWDNSAGH